MEEGASGLTIQAVSTAKMGQCPQCDQYSHHLHGWHYRQPQDLPCIGQQVRLALQVRRFCCRNAACSQSTFVERFPEMLPLYARRTNRLTRLLHQIAWEVGGESGRRILRYCQVSTSGDTLLRILRRETGKVSETARLIGVDDWAMKKGQRYGTIIVNLETHRVVELLPDRTAPTLAAWLQAHPAIELVTRDRSTEYAAGIQSGAAHVQQVADRWHLLLNLRQMLERWLNTIYAQVQQLPYSAQTKTVLQPPRQPFLRTHTEHQAKQTTRQQRLARYEQVQQLRQAGYSITEISRLLNFHRETVRKYYESPTFPERKQHLLVASLLDPYLPYLEQRLQTGCENASQLWREVQARGYPGSPRQVLKWLQAHRTQAAPTTPTRYLGTALTQPLPARPHLPSIRQLAWLLVQPVEQLPVESTILLEHLLQHPLIQHVYPLAQRFMTMMRKRQPEALDPWLDECRLSPCVQLRSFATGLQQDYSAVRAAFALAWSNGQTEGQVNRLKFIKRQMYGRAHFDLLRLRVLPPPPT